MASFRVIIAVFIVCTTGERNSYNFVFMFVFIMFIFTHYILIRDLFLIMFDTINFGWSNAYIEGS